MTIPSSFRFTVAATVAVASVLVASAQRPTPSSGRAVLYASVGEELITFDLDVERATLARRTSLMLQGFVQEAWDSPHAPFVYVAWSNGGSSYAGSGVEPRNDRHGVTAFRIASDGGLRQEGTPASIRSRPIHITGDVPGRHLLVAYSDPSGLSVYALNDNGTIGAEVAQRASIDAGVYGHQVRVLPSNRGVVLVTRGNEPTATTREDPGALKVFRYDAGRLLNEVSIAPPGGLGFRARHLDFHPTHPWVYLSVEAQNLLQMYRRTDDGLEPTPLFSKSTLAAGGGVIPGQTTSTIHVHPNGRYVYIGTRGAPGTGRLNEIAVFQIDQATGQPTLVQNVDTHGFTPRTFSLDPTGRVLVVGNQNTTSLRESDATSTVPANLAVFRIGGDGRLTFVQRYDVAVGRKPLWWMGIVPLR